MAQWSEELRGKSSKKWRCSMAILLLIVCAAGIWIPQARGQEGALEYRLKAIYLSRIPEFVQWPVSGGTNEPGVAGITHLCVVGSYNFGAALAQEAARASLSRKKMELNWIRKGLDLTSCEIVFVSVSGKKSYGRILQAASGTNALTVGEGGGFLEAGGMLELSFENNALKFEVNLAATRMTQLRLDARLLAMNPGAEIAAELEKAANAGRRNESEKLIEDLEKSLAAILSEVEVQLAGVKA